VNKIVNDLLTGKDNQTHDLGRWTWFIGFIAIIAIAIYEVIQSKAINLTELASALGIVSGAGGASVMMKQNSEPEA
jgi:hypothetical protein